ncbi:MAG: hypothetical protein NTZ03_13830 [Actinobacteria bacterium]|nr:hypothetical protein [Actinomycetota bacterium]
MQESLAFMIDVAQTLADRSVIGNAFLVDAKLDEPALNSLGDHQDSELFIRCTGVHHPDGSVLDEITLNWVIGGIASKPGVIAGSMKWGRIEGAPEPLSGSGLVGNSVAGLDGLPLTPEEIDRGGFLPPFIADITGQAVDDGVIFPARYGSPDLSTDGWYWSAVVDTHRVGTHHATMHIGVFRAVMDGDRPAWEPELYPCELHFEVDQIVAVNGFTGALAGYLPLPVPNEFVEPIDLSPVSEDESELDADAAEAGVDSDD